MLKDALVRWVATSVTGSVTLELRRGDDYTLVATRAPHMAYDPDKLSMEKVESAFSPEDRIGALEMQTPFDFYVGLDQDIELAQEIVREACLTSPYVFLAKEVPVQCKQVILGDYCAMLLKARPYVFDCKYEKAFETDVHLRVRKAFKKHGILPPALLHRRQGGDA